MQKMFINRLSNSKGMVLVTALLLTAILMVMATYMIQGMSTETMIAGSYEVNTKSLYIAEGGLEVIKSELKTNQADTFTNSTYSTGNSRNFLVNDGAYPMTTITNPVNYVGVGNGWYITKNPTTFALTDALSLTNPKWPIYKSVAVGSDAAIVQINRPRWFSSSPTQIQIPMASTTNNVANTNLLQKSVASNLDLEFDNNLMTFQSFRDPADDATLMDNFANNEVVIGLNPIVSTDPEDHNGTEGDYGIYSGATVISGIATFPKNTGRTVAIWKCAVATTADYGGFESLACAANPPIILPAVNNTNKTFIAGVIGTDYYGKVYTDPLATPSDFSDDVCVQLAAANIATYPDIDNLVEDTGYIVGYISTSLLTGTDCNTNP